MIDELRPGPEVQWWCGYCQTFHQVEYVPQERFVAVEDDHEATIQGRQDEND